MWIADVIHLQYTVSYFQALENYLDLLHREEDRVVHKLFGILG
jgi:hypothetical protein